MPNGGMGAPFVHSTNGEKTRGTFLGAASKWIGGISAWALCVGWGAGGVSSSCYMPYLKRTTGALAPVALFGAKALRTEQYA